MRRFAAWVLLLVCPVAASAQGFGPAAPPRARTYDLQHVKLDLDIDAQSRKLSGVATLRLAPLAPGLQRIDLDSIKLQIHAVESAGRALPFRTSAETLSVDLPRPLAAAETVELAIRYSARPSNGFVFILPDKQHPKRTPQAWSQGFPDVSRYWFPGYDFPNDKTTSELIVKAPKGWQVISNGRLLDHTGNTYHWLQDKPHATYLISLVAGEFDRVAENVDGVELSYYVPHGQVANVPVTFGRTPDALRFYVSRLGAYPWDKYAQTVVDGFQWGAMENTSATTAARSLLIEPALAEDLQATGDDTVAHELAHQWFGDLVTIADFRHVWLSEGFATFFAGLWTEHYYGRDLADWDRERTARYLTGEPNTKRFPVVRTHEDRDDPVGLLAYQKGAWVLHMLHRQLGDALFWKAIREYLTAYRFGNADTADFVRTVETATGQQVQRLIDQYVYRPGYPDLEATWAWDEAAHQVLLHIRQSEPLFDIPLEIELMTGAPSPRSTIRVANEEEVFMLPTEEKPATVILDPEQVLLKKLSFRKPEAEWMYQLLHGARAAIRSEAAAALARPGASDAAREVLAKTASEDAFFGVRVDAVRALGAVRNPASRSPLESLLDSPLSHVRRAAAEELAGLPHEERTVSALLRTARTDRSPVVRAAAIRSVGTLKPDRLLSLMESFLNEDSPRELVRTAAIGVIAQMGKGAQKTLQKWSAQGKPEEVRQIALAALRKR
jgi:aminopeptidase N